MTITALPTAPTPQDDAGTFNSRAFALVASLAQFVSEANVDISKCNQDALNAIAAAAASANSSNAEKWVSLTTYAAGKVVWSPANWQTYRRKIAGAGATDPSADTTNWASDKQDVAAETTARIAADAAHAALTAAHGATATPAASRIAMWDANGGLSLPASDTLAGVVELATADETFTTDATRAVSPAGLNASIAARVIEVWRSGASWYRKWSDGWIEQGGSGVYAGNVTINYPTPFNAPPLDIRYTVRVSDTLYIEIPGVEGVTATGFQTGHALNNSTAYTGHIWWSAAGYWN